MASVVDTATVNRINEIAEHVAFMRGTLESHLQDETRHQVPPCDAHKALSAKLWAIAVVSVTALISAVSGLIKGN